MLPTNDIVARITGMNKKLLTDTRESSDRIVDEDATLGGMGCPSPRDDINAQRGARTQREDIKAPTPMRGQNADYQYDPPQDVPSQDLKAPKQKMPPKTADADIFGVDDQDDQALEIGKRKATESKKSMNKFVKDYIGTMEDFRMYSGVSLVEDIETMRAGHTGEVPTGGVAKDNKMPAGSAGLQGEPLQAVEPEDAEGEEDGDAEEMTLDHCIAMLKKENVDTEELWAEFLEQRGLSVEIFDQLVAEAIEGDDPAEIDQLLAVESLFVRALPRLLPEGLRDLFGMKKKAQPDIMAPVKAATAAIRTYGAAKVRAANAHGTTPNKVVLKPAYQQDYSGSNRSQRSRSATRQMAKGESKEMPKMTLKVPHNKKTGEPHMPWHGAMEGLADKYDLAEGKAHWIQKMHMKKGALHKELGVPVGKKIPAKKLNAAAKAGGLEGKRASLAKTLKKLGK